MNRRNSLGAIGFPAFLLAWTAGLVGLADSVWELAPFHDVLRDQSWEQPNEMRPAGGEVWERAPALDLPTLYDPQAWSSAMAHLARHSEVMNGRWQPQGAALAAAPEPSRGGRVEAVTEVVVPTLSHRGREAPATEPVVVRKTPVTVNHVLTLDKSQARRALEEGLAHQAYALLRPQVAAGRTDTEFLGLLALAALHTGNDGEALVLYRRLASLEPDRGRWHAGLALAQERLGLDATGVFREALALSEPAGMLQQALKARLGGTT